MKLRSRKTLASRPKKTKTKTTTSDHWPSILKDVLHLIAGKIVSVDDYVRFTAVCRSWYSLATDFYDDYKHKLNPPLYMSSTNPDTKRFELRNPASDAVRVVHAPETAGTRCWGSPFGWVVTCDLNNLRFTLLNPLTGATIPLPVLPKSLSCRRNRDRIRAFLTANPDSDPDNCLVVIVLPSLKLIFTRPAKHTKFWSHIQGFLDLSDLTYSKGKLYGIQFSCLLPFVRLFLFESNTFNLILTLNLTSHRNERSLCLSDRYLVDLNGELCLCVRYYSNYYSSVRSTKDFKVFKIDVCTGRLSHVPSLGDHCLFLGNNYSFPCKTSYPPNMLFAPSRDGTSEFVSNYVFYTYYRDWNSLAHVSSDQCPFDVEVWDMLRSVRVCWRRESLTRSYGPLCIVPCISFHKLEGEVMGDELRKKWSRALKKIT